MASVKNIGTEEFPKVESKKQQCPEPQIMHPTLKATTEIRRSFDGIVNKESFLQSSETIIKYFLPLIPHEEIELELCPENFKYILKRLLAGLNSLREYARHGFFTTLSIILKLNEKVLPYVLKTMANTYKDMPVNDVETGLGQILCIGAIIRSGNLVDNPEVIKDFLSTLLCPDLKNYAYPVAGQFMVDLLVLYDDVKICKELWSRVGSKLIANVNSLTPALLWLKIVFSRNKYVEKLKDVDDKFQKGIYEEECYPAIIQTFQNMANEDVNVTPIISDFFETISQLPNAKKGPDNIASFFKVVKPSFKSSLKNKIFYFNIVHLALPYVTKNSHVEAIITTRVLEMTLEAKKTGSEAVIGSARSLLAAILQLIVRLKNLKKSEVQFTVIMQFLNTSASYDFDTASGTDLLQEINEHLSVDSVKLLSSHLRAEATKIYESKAKMESESKVFLTLVQWLSHLVCNPNMLSSQLSEWRTEQMMAIVEFSFFFPHTTNLQKKLTSCFMRTLKQLTKALENQLLIVESMVKKTSQLIEAKSKSCFLSDDEKEVFKNITAKIEKISANAHGNEKHYLIFKLLYCHIALHLFLNPTDSLQLLEKVDLCYENTFEKGHKVVGKSYENNRKLGKKVEKSNSKVKNKLKNDWVMTAVDLMLFILSYKEENYWRKVVVSVFKYICDSIKPESLHVITDLLDHTKNEVAIENESENDSEFENDVENSKKRKKIATVSENKNKKMKITEENDCEDAISDSDSGNDSEIDIESGFDSDFDSEADTDNENGVKLMQLKMQMQKIVGVPTESDLDIDQAPATELKNIDKNLGSLIGQFLNLKQNKKQQQKFLLKQEIKDETMLMNFRMRVCDLLDGIISEAPSIRHILSVIKAVVAILDQASNEKQAPLVIRLRSCLVEACKLKKFKAESLNYEELVDELNCFIQMIPKVASRSSKNLGHCISFVIKNVIALNENDNKSIFEVLVQNMEKIFQKDIMLLESTMHIESEHLCLVLNKIISLTFKKSSTNVQRSAGLESIKLIFNNDKSLSKFGKKNFEILSEKITEKICGAFDSTKDRKQVQTKFIQNVFELIRTMKNVDKKHSELNFDWLKISNSFENFVERVHLNDFKSLKKALYSMVKILNVQTPEFKKSENKEKITEKCKIENLHKNNKKNKTVEVKLNKNHKNFDKNKLIEKKSNKKNKNSKELHENKTNEGKSYTKNTLNSCKNDVAIDNNLEKCKNKEEIIQKEVKEFSKKKNKSKKIKMHFKHNESEDKKKDTKLKRKFEINDTEKKRSKKNKKEKGIESNLNY